MERKNRTWLNLDWLSILLYLGLITMGLINIYSAEYVEGGIGFFDFSQRYGVQFMWLLIGLVIGFFILVVDSKFYVTFAYVFYVGFLLLLILVLLVGKEVNGAKSWIQIGGFGFQPAEFAKLGTALAVSRYIGSKSFNSSNYNSFLVLGMIIGIPVMLIILQNDTGSALVYSVFILAFYREGMSGLFLLMGFILAMLFVLSFWMQPIILLLILVGIALIAFVLIRRSRRELFSVISIWAIISAMVWAYVILLGKEVDLYYILIRSSLTTAVGLVVFSMLRQVKWLPMVGGAFIFALIYVLSIEYVYNNVMNEYQQDRIENMLGIKPDPYGVGYHVNQSKIAIGSGGLHGKGFLNGTQTKFDFVPEQSTDFIFCTVGEEWGFIGTSLVVILFVFLITRLVYVAERQRSTFSRVYGYAVAGIIFFHFAINISMTIGLAPVIGIPLPFFSYGGSSLLFFTMLLFIFLRLDTNRLEQLHS